MIIRGARNSDIRLIERLYKEMDYQLDSRHVECILIAEEKDPVAILTLNTVLEGTLLTVKDSRPRAKIEAIKKLIYCGTNEIRRLGYPHAHSFANELIAPMLKKHFEFKPGVGENLVLFVE